MYLTKTITRLTIKTLAESIDIRAIVHLTRELIANYDLNERMDIPENLPIPRREAARQILADISVENLYLEMISLLIQVQEQGYRGRNYNFVGLRDILWEIKKQGFLYDPEYEMFVEDPAQRRTRNWGTLRPGNEYLFVFLRIDIVGYSSLVRSAPAHDIQADYLQLDSIIHQSVDKRNGRIWCQDGDGILIAFYFSNKYLLAVLSAMEILHEMFIYNKVESHLQTPFRLRIAVHSGNVEYTADPEEIKKDEVIKAIIDMESNHTNPETITISNIVTGMLDPLLVKYLEALKTGHQTHYKYGLNWE